MKIIGLIKGALLAFCLVLPEVVSADRGGGTDIGKRRVAGWVERIKILPEGLYFDAKLTPGSEGNALHAENLQHIKKEGKSFVAFDVEDRKGVKKRLEKEVADSTVVITTDGSKEKRYKVKLGYCLGKTYMESDFQLADRSNFDFEARIGREVLAGQFLIDPSAEKLQKPRCKKR